MANSIPVREPRRLPRILVAFVIAIVLIAGAYIVSDPNIFNAKVANAQSTAALLQAFAEQKGPDGRPLWEDELIATSSTTPTAAIVPTTSNTSSTSSDFTGNTLTDQFAESLFTQYVNESSDSSQPSDDDINTLAQNAIQTAVQNHVQQNAYSQSNEHVAGSGPAALEAYAVAAQSAFNDNTISTSETGIDYFADAVEKNQPNDLQMVAGIGQEYDAIAAALMQVPVPTQAQYAHLEIANSLTKLAQDYADMSTFGTDPLRAYLGLSSYENDAQSFTQGIADMQKVFASEQVTIQKGQPGYSFYLTLQLPASQ
jgi:hypothetical protein